jgi:hypothetical protein
VHECNEPIAEWGGLVAIYSKSQYNHWALRFHGFGLQLEFAVFKPRNMDYAPEPILLTKDS